MPAPQKSVMSNLAKNNFRSNSIKLPKDWSEPGDQFSDAFKESEKSAPPNSPTTLFKEATQNKYHVDTAREIGKKFGKYIDGICGAICGAIDKWMKMMTITTCVINATAGIIPPSGVMGPPLMPLIMSSAPKATAQEAKYSNAIANALSTLWQAWQSGLTGVLNFPPNFASFPGPVCPPTPNIPMPLGALSSPGEAGLSAASLKGMMMANLADPAALHAPELFDAISQAFNTVFQTFKSSTMINNVLGTGPVPSFAPPAAPVGPVAGGAVIPKPGILT